MKKIVFSVFLLSMVLSFAAAPAQAAKKKQPAASARQIQQDSRDESSEESDGDKKAPAPGSSATKPYLGAILIEAASGKVLFEDNADVKSPPASIIKLMNMLIILENVKNRSIALQDRIKVTAEASKTGGSQVYLKEGEEFTVEELLYALMVQSANDAAVALAIHVGGTKDAFVDLMNRKAQQLGMTNTKFNSVHGLPPGKDQLPDTSTPRDIAKLCQELLKWDVLKYSSVKERPFRADAAQPFIMRNHNHLIGNFEGCDGLKTGYYRAAGFSIAATATKKNLRAIAVVFGSENRHVRDAKTRELLAKGLAELARSAPPVAPAGQAPAQEQQQAAPAKPEEKDVIQISTQTLKTIGVAVASLIVLIALVAIFKGRKKRNLLNG